MHIYIHIYICIYISMYICMYIYICICMVVFVIAHCRNMHNITPHGVTAAEALISTSAVVQEGSAKHL